jgi:radical SAM superfamily enzyme YgiQ (UPF0313 family)
MKIRLIAPKMSLRPMDSEFKRLMTPSISLLVLAALTPEEHQIEIQDENLAPITFDASPDLVGITSNVDMSQRGFDIARKYRELHIPVIMGGIFPSSCPEQVLNHADSVCIGEAENVWQSILDDVQHGILKKVYQWKGSPDLSRVPRPKWEAIDCRKYLYTNIITTSRSCPHGCEFCYNSCEYTIKCYRRRPIPNVLAEIEKLETNQVMFVDDNFIGDTDWAIAFLAAIKPKKLTWHAAVSVDIGRKLELLDLMTDSGCKSLYIGFESINASSISSVNKKQNAVDHYEKTITAIHDRAMMINASMVFGFDHDNPAVFDTTLHWLVSNHIETMTAHILTPYPETKLYKRLEKEGRIIDRNYEHYNTAHVVFQPKLMTPEELYQGYLEMYTGFYSLNNIWNRRPRLKSVWYPYFLFNFGYRKFGKITSRIGKLGCMNFLGQLARRLSYGIG